MPYEIVPCAACDGRVTRPVQIGMHRLARCERCGLVYVNPRAPKDAIWKRYSPEYFWHEQLAAALAPTGGVYRPEYFDWLYAGILGLIGRHVTPAPGTPAPGRLFEIGTGGGLFLKTAERAGWSVAGIELSAEAVAYARLQLGLDVREGMAETLELPGGSIDVVVMIEVAEHLLDPLRALRAVRQILRPGGLLFLSTPNFNALSRLGLGAGWHVLTPNEHLYYFTEDSLARVLRRAGFSQVRFVRRYAALRVFPAMNAHVTHTPGWWRSKVYRAFTRLLGPAAAPFVTAAGWGDTLVALAQRPLADTAPA